MQIEVFIPPNQCHDGTLELCNLHKNIAIVSFKKGFNAIHPEDIFNEGIQESSSEKVVALGRDPIHGLLMGTIGKVKRNYKDRKLECQELRCSTCKIKKVVLNFSYCLFFFAWWPVLGNCIRIQALFNHIYIRN